jgi:hypothetical protein
MISTMLRSARGFAVLICCLGAAAGPAAAQKLPPEDMEHIREELGVNGFTAPSIEIVLQELNNLKPIPFDKTWRDLPDATPQDRPRLALGMGAVIADGFLAVAAEKQSRIEPVGRVLLKYARGLGVADHVNKHSRSILEKAARQQWPEIKQELIRTQAEVEAAMLGLKDEEIAHLVALGGWLRGLEMTSGVVVESYTPQRAGRLVQPALLDYFIDRVSTLNPTLKKSPLGETIEKDLKEVKRIISKPPDALLTESDAKQIHDLAREMNRMIANGGE